MRESAEDLFPADRLLGEVDRFGLRLSDGALVDVAPSRVRVLEQDDDGMVGFFVVCSGVLAG